MEEYNKIYPELSKEPPKDGNAFRKKIKLSGS